MQAIWCEFFIFNLKRRGGLFYTESFNRLRQSPHPATSGGKPRPKCCGQTLNCRKPRLGGCLWRRWHPAASGDNSGDTLIFSSFYTFSMPCGRVRTLPQAAGNRVQNAVDKLWIAEKPRLGGCLWRRWHPAASGDNSGDTLIFSSFYTFSMPRGRVRALATSGGKPRPKCCGQTLDCRKPRLGGCLWQSRNPASSGDNSGDTLIFSYFYTFPMPCGRVRTLPRAAGNRVQNAVDRLWIAEKPRLGGCLWRSRNPAARCAIKIRDKRGAAGTAKELVFLTHVLMIFNHK